LVRQGAGLLIEQGYWSGGGRTDTICPMKPDEKRAKTAIYLLLLALQIFGAIFLVWQELPEFRQVLINPGEQLPKDAGSDVMMLGVFLSCKSRSGFVCFSSRYRSGVRTCS
jgi:hypothetical protein